MNLTDHEFDDTWDFYRLSSFELAVWCFLYACIAFFSVVGNSLVLYITFHKLGACSITQYFIINLAFADLFTGLFAIPFKFQAALFQKWYFPPQFCKIVPYVETVTLSVSVFTLTASAIHEFRTVFCQKSVRIGSQSARKLVLSIWLMAVILALPHGLFHQVFLIPEIDNTTTPQCLPTYAEEGWWKLYNVYLTIIHYFVPMIILDTAYLMIALKIWRTTRIPDKRIGEPKQFTREMSNHKLLKMLLIVVVCFSLCWLPLETYLLLNELKPEINGWRYINLLFFASHWLAMSNSCLNPIIYGLFNTTYNKEYRLVFSRLFGSEKKSRKGDGDAAFDWQVDSSPKSAILPSRRWNSIDDVLSNEETWAINTTVPGTEESTPIEKIKSSKL